MDLSIDPDVKAVAEIMQATIPAEKLVSVATGIAAIAPLLWGRHPAEDVRILRLERIDDDDDSAIEASAEHALSNANG